jgi:hypothetical protein
VENKIVLILSILLAALIAFVSCVGLLSENFYSSETLNWRTQTYGQDIVDLFLVVPALIVASLFAFKRNILATLAWAGIILYLNYTFLIYCFDIHFNRLFIFYCFSLGLSFYAFIYFLIANDSRNIYWITNKTPLKTTAIYFMTIGCFFYLLWLLEVIPAIVQNSTPKSVHEAGLFTNPVHVIDLAIFLPGVFITGFFIQRRKSLALSLAPVLLVFFVLMDITIGLLIVLMKINKLESNLWIAAMMAALALFSLRLLLQYFKK